MFMDVTAIIVDQAKSIKAHLPELLVSKTIGDCFYKLD